MHLLPTRLMYLEYEQNNGNVKGELRDKKANVMKLRNQKYEFGTQ